MSKLRSKFVVLSVAVCAAAALFLGATLSVSRSDKLSKGVSIAGIGVAGLSKEQAATRVSSVIAGKLRQSVCLVAGEQRWVGELRDLGVHGDVLRAVERAYRVGREEGLLRRTWIALAGPQTNIPLRYVVDRKQLDCTLEKIAKAVEYPHEDAKLSLIDGRFVVEPDRIGIKLDKAESAKLLEAAVQAGQPAFSVKIVRDMPDVTASDLAQVDTVLAAFTTRFPAFRKDRTHNIRTAASKVDGTVVKPGEVFSYNDTVGPRLKSLGYRDAPIFVKGKLVPGTGGGICQLSSTIYNAALLANMKIVERSHHSSTVPYVSAGRDATVAYGLLDFRFRNTTSAPIYISTKLKGSYLHVDICGSSRDKADVDLVVERQGKLKATLYRLVKENGKVVLRERISRDTYKPAEPMEVASTAKKRAKAGDAGIRVVPAKQSGDGDGPKRAASIAR